MSAVVRSTAELHQRFLERRATEAGGEDFKRHDGDVAFLKADVANIPLPSESIDRVICFRTFADIDDKRGALRQYFRVLRPGGIVVICNLLGSKEHDELSKAVGGVIANDTSPGVREMEQFFLESNFTPIELLDSDTLYMMKARKPPR